MPKGWRRLDDRVMTRAQALCKGIYHLSWPWRTVDQLLLICHGCMDSFSTYLCIIVSLQNGLSQDCLAVSSGSMYRQILLRLRIVVAPCFHKTCSASRPRIEMNCSLCDAGLNLMQLRCRRCDVGLFESSGRRGLRFLPSQCTLHWV